MVMNKADLKKLIKEQLLEIAGASTVELTPNSIKSVILSSEDGDHGFMVTNLSQQNISVEVKRVSASTFITIR